MWLVELNVAGRRFTHELHPRRPAFRTRTRGLVRRFALPRQTRTA